jgi:phosphatidate phosphatase LPIN
MSFFNIVKNVKEFYSEINGSTLTGAIDVIVVEQEDGTLKSSPFHVRFGKMGVLKAKEKIVDIEINGEPVEIQMKLDDTGAAFFVEEVDELDDSWQDNLQTSPLPRQSAFQKEENEEETDPDFEHCEDILTIVASDLEGQNKREFRRKDTTNCSDEMFDMDDISDLEVACEIDSLENVKTIEQNDKEQFLTRVSYLSNREHSLENLSIQSEENSNRLMVQETFQPKSVSSGFYYFPDKSSRHTASLHHQLEESESKNLWRWGELPEAGGSSYIIDNVNHSNSESEEKKSKEQSWFGSWSTNNKEKERTEGVYLDVIEKRQELLDEYIGSNETKVLRKPDKIDSGCEDDADINTNSDLSRLLSHHVPDLAASLCGGVADGDISPEQFQLNILDYSEFLAKLSAGPNSLMKNPNLVIRVNGDYLTWEKAAPILFSVVFFKQPLPTEVVSELTKYSDNSVIDSTQTEPTDAIAIKCTSTRTFFRKSLRLSSDKLAELKLRSGMNEIEFSVTTAFQGTSRCKCHIYLWHHQDKVVISDIDGTITKSDVLGHILPVIGQTWAQSGVADLFSKIKSNGYHIMYLTARAIGQASTTKGYLQTLKQGDLCLPDGPLFLNPDSLVRALKREVIDRNPEEFKIRCLKDIQSLFEDKNPFFAGYGNRPNDAFAYRAIGIPVSRIFTINPAGELKHELTQHFQTTYESQSLQVDYYFPNLVTIQQIKNQLKAFPRKQSVYFDAFEFAENDEKTVFGEANENISDTEDQNVPFRVRSGTDISDSVNVARYKLKLKRKSLKMKPEPGVIDLLKEEQKSLITKCPSQLSLQEVSLALPKISSEYPNDKADFTAASDDIFHKSFSSTDVEALLVEEL